MLSSHSSGAITRLSRRRIGSRSTGVLCSPARPLKHSCPGSKMNRTSWPSDSSRKPIPDRRIYPALAASLAGKTVCHPFKYCWHPTSRQDASRQWVSLGLAAFQWVVIYSSRIPGARSDPARRAGRARRRTLGGPTLSDASRSRRPPVWSLCRPLGQPSRCLTPGP